MRMRNFIDDMRKVSPNTMPEGRYAAPGERYNSRIPMAGTSRNWRVPAALVIAAALVVGAYVLGSQTASTPVAEASTETALLQTIATRDSNGDGLPDWEKALYGIPVDSTTTDYFHLGMTDGEAVARGLIVPKAIADVPLATSTGVVTTSPDAPAPAASGSLTDTFAKNFFTAYLAMKQANGDAALTQAQMSTLEQQTLNNLSVSIVPAPDFKTMSDLTVSGSGSTALETFAVAAENVMRVHTVQLPKSELQYLQDALDGNTTAIGHISQIAKAYRDIATGFAALSMPKEVASDMLALINSMARIGEVATDFTRFKTDPIASMLALEQYPTAVRTMAHAFQDISAVYATAGVTLAPGTPGGSFIHIGDAITATTATSSTP